MSDGQGRGRGCSPIEGLTKDELVAGADYVSVMRDNLGALRRALDCR
jgi:hypothetical protein